MISKILIWFYIICIVPPLAIIIGSLVYGGVVETIKIHQKK